MFTFSYVPNTVLGIGPSDLTGRVGRVGTIWQLQREVVSGEVTGLL